MLSVVGLEAVAVEYTAAVANLDRGEAVAQEDSLAAHKDSARVGLLVGAVAIPDRDQEDREM